MPSRLFAVIAASLLLFVGAVHAGDENDNMAAVSESESSIASSAESSTELEQASWRLQWDLGLQVTDMSAGWKQTSESAAGITNTTVDYQNIKSQGWQTDLQFEVFEGFLANTLWELSLTQDAIDKGVSEADSIGIAPATSGTGEIDGDKVSALSLGVGVSKRFSRSRFAMLVGYYQQEQSLTAANNSTIDLPSAFDISTAGPWLAFDVSERAGNHLFNLRAEIRGGDSDVDIAYAASKQSYSVGGSTGLMSLRYDYLFLQHWSVWLKGQVARQSVKTYKESASAANANTALKIRNMDIASEQLAVGMSLSF